MTRRRPSTHPSAEPFVVSASSRPGARADAHPRLHRSLAGAATALLALALLASPSAAQRIKMATLSPEGSPWDKILKDMGAAWEASTDGRVSLVLYPGGVAGDEPDILRKMRIGQYQGGALSVAGLSDIDRDFTVFQIPLFYEDFAELKHVLEVLTPTLDQTLERRGFKRLAWGYVGWVYFFTSSPAPTVADMQRLKIFTWAGDETMVQWWRRNGFQPVALAATDIHTGLETGMIDAISVPPLYAMQMQYYKKAPHMADIGLAPLIGAVLLDLRTWNRIQEQDRPAVLAAGREAEAKVLTQIPKLDETAIKLMESQGLTVVEIKDTAKAQEWIEAAQRFAQDMRGDIVPEAIFDLSLAARDAYRRRAASSSAPSGDR